MFKSSLKIAVAFGLLAITFAARPAAANALTYLDDVLSTYNVFVFGNMGTAANPYSSDSQGPVAVGGNAYLQDFTVAGVTNNGVNALTVGGNLNQLRATDGGNVFVGGNADFHDGSQGGVTVQGTITVDGTLVNAPTQYVGPRLTGPSPLDFLTAQTLIDSASTALSHGTGGSVGAVVYNNAFNQKELDFTGTDPVLNVFNVSGDALSQIGGVLPDFSDGGGSLHINVPTGATAIINVSGLNVNFGHPGNFGFFCDGIACTNQDAGTVLFNFFEAQTLSMQSVLGTILAPFADVTYTNGQALGSVIAGSLGGPLYRTGEFHEIAFVGTLGSIPAPAALPLMLVGLLGVFGLRRRV